MKTSRKLRECRHHGKTDFALEGQSKWICVKCRSRRATERRSVLKKRLVDLFGGTCQVCGYDKCVGALHFHHVDPSQKEFGLSSCRNIAWGKMLKEAKKCVLLCANCHYEVESGLVNLEVLNVHPPELIRDAA